MKILFLCNITPPVVSRFFGNNSEVCGGWIVSLIEQLKNEDLVITVVFPYEKSINKLEIEGISYYGFVRKYKEPTKYDSSLEIHFKEILSNEKPDIVHIFGTEFPHTLTMTRAFKRPERTVCHIQGLVSIYGKHYASGIPHNVCHISTLRDFLRHDNIAQQQKKFYKRGAFEIEALKNIGHIMGRTEWDKACTKIINPKAQYHYVQEIMRDPFYDGQWEYKDCEKHSIFMSQGGYPIKGLHYVLEALYLLKEKYPDVKLYIAGDNLLEIKSFITKIKVSSYIKYIRKLIKQYNIKESVVFTGRLSAQEMKHYYLKCNVFVSASTIENSPNSIGEAMLLGVPVVGSDVGGVSSIAIHNKSAFLYSVDETYMLAHYVEKIFDNFEIAKTLGNSAKENALKMYDKENIKNQVLKVYRFMRLFEK